MKLPWGLNLGLQMFLFLGFLIFITVVENKPENAPSAPEKSRPSNEPRETPFPNSRVDRVVTIGYPPSEHRIGIAYLLKDRRNAGYFLGAGKPSNVRLGEVQRVLRMYDASTMEKTGIHWIVMVPDYKWNGRRLVSTGGSSPHNLLTLNTDASGDDVVSHLHHEIYWRLEERIAPTLKDGWPETGYSEVAYLQSRRLFATAPNCHVSAYASAHPVADRAETFRALMTRPSDLRRAMADDRCLSNKVNILKRNLERDLPTVYFGAIP